VTDYVDTAGLATQTWIEDELVVLLPAARKRQRPGVMRFAQLLDRPFVGLSAESGLSRFLLQQAARSGRVPQHRVRVSSFDAVARIVEAGVGVAVVPLSAASRWRESKVLIAPLEDAWAKRRLLVCSTAQAEALPGVRALINDLRVA
jgi:DNA-binding transcriptional LysR family regulator